MVDVDRPGGSADDVRRADPDFLQAGGEMGALIRAHDWDSTSLGAPETWPQPLRTAVRLLLNTGHPMYVWWGPELLCFYNDAYRQSIGPERHPSSLGRPAREVWDEIWDVIGPQIAQVMSGGGASWSENALIPITRNGRREDVYWTYSYGPIDDVGAPNGVGGVLVICAETTATVLAGRRRAAELAHQRRLLEQAPGFIIVMRGREHVVEFVNDAHRAVFGSHTWVGQPIRTAFPSIVGQDFFDRLDRVYASGETYQAHGAEVRYRRNADEPDETRFLTFIYAPLLDQHGAISGIFCEGFDVTEAERGKRTLIENQARLHEREEQLRLATEAAEIGFWDLVVDDDRLYWPARVKTMFGISPDVPISMADFYGGLHPEDRDRVSAAFDAAVDPAQRALYDVEFRTVGREDGMVRWVAAKGRAIFDGDQCRRVIGTAIDISGRKAAEERLQELNETLERRVSEALAERKILADVVEATDALIQVVGLDGRLMAINRASADAFERVFGVRPKVGDDVLALLASHPEQHAASEAVWRRALAGDAFTTTEAIDESDLDRRYYAMTLNPLRDRNGAVIGAFQFAYDVTDRLRDQARLAEAEAHLRQAQKIEAIGQLTGGVAHDFNNLLMVISGGLSILDRQTEPERRQRIIDGMRQAAERGASLSRQLLAFARRQPLKAEPVDLRWQIAGMRDLLDRTLRGDVEVRTELAEDLWPVEVDPAELELVMLNLCVNARDAMPDGGAITVRAENVANLQTGELCGDFVRLTVSDSGTGMPAEVIARVFEPFYTTKEIGKGSGLGLPQVHGFAHQSGGSVGIDSVVGRGTTVELLLPRTTNTPPAPVASPANPPPRPAGAADRRGVVLLVEDDDDVAALVSEMLRQLGFEVTRAASAAAALGALADGRPVDLVFSDIMMPGAMSGVDLARDLQRRRPALPVLLTSGYAEAAARDAVVESVAVLRKPYDLEALDRALTVALAGAPAA